MGAWARECAGSLGWDVYRRFSEFVDFHANLGSLRQVPELPPKKIALGRKKFDPSFLEERRRALESYLVAVVRQAGLEHSEVDDFLEFSEHVL